MKKLLICSMLLSSVIVSMAQVKLISIEKPIAQNLQEKLIQIPVEKPKKLVAFRLSSDAGDQSSYIITSETIKKYTGIPLEFSYKDFDSGNNVRGNGFAVSQTGLYHFDVRIDFFYNVAVQINDFELMLCLGESEILDKKRFKIMVNEEFAPSINMSLSTSLFLVEGTVIYPSFKFNGDPYAGVVISFISFSGFKISQ